MITDELTGLPNRNEFVKYFSNLNFGTTDKDSWLAFVDIDTFIWINDKFGHVHGDQILKDIAQLIQLETKSHNLFPFRVGGDEFAIVGINMALERFNWLMKKIQHGVAKQNFEYKCDDPNRDHLTVSVGICAVPKQIVENAMALLEPLVEQIYKEKQICKKLYEAFYAPAQTDT